MKRLNMARSRKLMAATALITALAVGASSAYAWGGRQAPEQRLDYIFTQLNLTEAQKEQTLAIFAERAEQQRSAMRERRDANRESGERPEKPSAEERDAMRAAMRIELSDQLGTVLQAHQVEGLVEYLEAHSGGMMRKEMRHRNHGFSN